MTHPDILLSRQAVAFQDAGTAVLTGEPVEDEERLARLSSLAQGGLLAGREGAYIHADVVALLASQVAQLRQEVAELKKRSSAQRSSAKKKVTA